MSVLSSVDLQEAVITAPTLQCFCSASNRDAYEVCSLIPDPSERGQCYSVFGIDAQRMNNYFETVSQLEGQLTSDFQQGGKEQISLGVWLWCIYSLHVLS